MRSELSSGEAKLTKSVAIIGTRGYPSYYGGFETAVRRLAPFLCDQGWEVTVYGRPDGVRENDAHRDTRVHSVITAGLETKQLSTLSFGLTAVIATIRLRPDVALVMNVANGFWLPLLKLAGIPSVVNVDGIEWERAKWGKAARRMFRFGADLTARFGTHLVADAREIRRRWASITKKELEFIPYGGDEPGTLAVPAGVMPGTYALLVARFVPENSIEEFLDAARIISKTNQVVLVGSSGYADPIEEKVSRLAASEERITWLGHVSDDDFLHGLWQNAGVYFHGHSVGGTNPALVQAMACSAPIVARDTAYNREVLADTSMFVKPDGAAIADACLLVLRDHELREKMKRQTYVRSRTHYSWEGVCTAYEKLLEHARESNRRLTHTA